MASNLPFEEGLVEKAADYDESGKGYSLTWDFCPECNNPIVILETGKYEAGLINTDVEGADQRTIYPINYTRFVPPEVPEPYRKDFLEACAVLPLSPKASAALSRRNLQNILREEFSIQPSNLAQEIQHFIQMSGVPSYLTQAVDAVRNVGNFAAHPSKDTSANQIVDVEPGESEWLIEVIESLFDFTFVQPKKLDERKSNLNDKLKQLGKPEMKG